MIEKDLHVVCFASKQLWPNLLGLLHVHRRIKKLFIYASDHESESFGPAKRLAAMAESLDVEVHPVEKLRIESHEVARQIQMWMEEFPGQWQIQMTGGLKLMTLGAASFGTDRNVQLVYRELDSGWRSVILDKGVFHSTIIESWDDKKLLGYFAPSDFAKLQFGTDHAEPQADRLHKKPDLANLIESGVTSRWNFRSMMRAPDFGKGFEYFIGSCVLALGAAHVEVDFVMSNKMRVKVLDVDVFATTQTGMVLIECKAGECDLSQQIGIQAVRARQLGGLSAKPALVCWSKPGNEGIWDHAKANGVTFIGKNEMPTLLSCLARLLGTELTPSEKALESQMAASLRT